MASTDTQTHASKQPDTFLETPRGGAWVRQRINKQRGDSSNTETQINSTHTEADTHGGDGDAQKSGTKRAENGDAVGLNVSQRQTVVYTLYPISQHRPLPDPVAPAVSLLL